MERTRPRPHLVPRRKLQQLSRPRRRLPSSLPKEAMSIINQESDYYFDRIQSFLEDQEKEQSPSAHSYRPVTYDSPQPTSTEPRRNFGPREGGSVTNLAKHGSPYYPKRPATPWRARDSDSRGQTPRSHDFAMETRRQPSTPRAQSPEPIVIATTPIPDSPAPIQPGPLELPEPALPIETTIPPTPTILPRDWSRTNTSRTRRSSRYGDFRRIDNIEEARRAIVALADWQWRSANARERDLIRDMAYNVLYRRFE